MTETKQTIEATKFYQACGGDFRTANDRLCRARDLLFIQKRRKSAEQVEIIRRQLVRIYA